MIVEVTGIGYPNKGAELMLCAVAEHVLQNWGSDVIVATRPSLGRDAGYRALSQCGCHQMAFLNWKGVDLGTPLGNLAPKKLLRTYGMVAEKETEIVLDASGLRYTDKWGLNSIKSAIKEYRRVKARGGRVILLPQAFGPFERSEIREAMRDLLDTVDLAFARDPQSLEYLLGVAQKSGKIRESPDFTCEVNGTVPYDADRFRGKIAIIPNSRMLDKTSSEVAKNYFDNLCAFVSFCFDSEIGVFVLNHEGAQDDALCKRLLGAFPEGCIPYSGCRSAKEVKGLISLASGVMTSRFHGLVSSLTQGVPALCSSWNHKYEQLMKAFDVPDGVLDFSKGTEGFLCQLVSQFDRFLHSEADALVHRSHDYCNETRKMWRLVKEVSKIR